MERTTVSTSRAARVHIGCSGWVYKHWRGILYPEGLPQRLWFDRYAQDLQTVITLGLRTTDTALILPHPPYGIGSATSLIVQKLQDIPKGDATTLEAWNTSSLRTRFKRTAAQT